MPCLKPTGLKRRRCWWERLTLNLVLHTFIQKVNFSYLFIIVFPPTSMTQCTITLHPPTSRRNQMPTIKTFNIPALVLKQKMHLQSLQPYVTQTPQKQRMSTIPLSCSNNTLLPSSELFTLLHLGYINCIIHCCLNPSNRFPTLCIV